MGLPSNMSGAYGNKLLPETMGSDVAVLDYDQELANQKSRQRPVLG